MTGISGSGLARGFGVQTKMPYGDPSVKTHLYYYVPLLEMQQLLVQSTVGWRRFY